jgi:hypothetical protein
MNQPQEAVHLPIAASSGGGVRPAVMCGWPREMHDPVVKGDVHQQGG